MKNKMPLFIVNVSFFPNFSGQDFFVQNLISRIDMQKYDITFITAKLKGNKKEELKDGIRIIRLETRYSSNLESYREIHRDTGFIRDFFIEFNRNLILFLKSNCKENTKIILNSYELSYNLDEIIKICKDVSVVMHYLGHEMILSRIYIDKMRERYLVQDLGEKILIFFTRTFNIKKERVIFLLNQMIKEDKIHRFIGAFSKNAYFYLKSMGNLMALNVSVIVPTKEMGEYFSGIKKEGKVILFDWPYISKIGYHGNRAKSKTKNYTFLGRISDQKGVDYLIEAMKELEKGGIYGIVLNIAGGFIEKDETYYRKIIENSKAIKKNKINFLGHITGSRKDKILRKTDYFIFPSVYEPFGYVVLEAIDYGKPVIVSDCEGPRSILTGSCAFIVDYKDSKMRVCNLVEAIKKSSHCDKTLSEKNRKKILEKHSKLFDPEKQFF